MTKNHIGAPPLVAHIIYALSTGGLENGLINLINRCPPGRYRHAIICLVDAQGFSRRLTVPNVEIIELHKKPGHDPAMYWRLWRTLRRLQPAIVHTRNLAALETQLLGFLMPGCKRVHGEHGRDMSDLDGQNRKYRWLRRLLHPVIHRFIAVSCDLASWLVDSVQIPPSKVVQIYNGVDHESFAPGAIAALPGCGPAGIPAGFMTAPASLVVGTVGRLAKVKDQQLIMLALKKIFADQPKRRESLYCIIVGDGPEREALETDIVRMNLSGSVWLAGDRDDIPALLGCMDIFLLPSMGEGISNTILEAMASGLPVIATNVGGNPELVEVGVNGSLIPVGDADALAREILVLLEDASMRKQMGENAMQYVRSNFDWNRTVGSYLQVYDEVLQRPAAQLQAGGV